MSHCQLARPDRFGIMLDQSWRWVDLGKLLLLYTDNRAIVIEEDRSRTGGALVQGKDILCHSYPSFFSVQYVAPLQNNDVSHWYRCPHLCRLQKTTETCM